MPDRRPDLDCEGGSGDYVQIGAIVGATTSNTPSCIWNQMTNPQRQEALKALINSAIANRSQILFNVNPFGTDAGPWLHNEVEYLLSLNQRKCKIGTGPG